MSRRLISALVAAVSVMSLASCGDLPAAKAQSKDSQTEAAQRAADNVHFSGNSEITNISKRLELTSKPGAIGFILLLNEAGQPILYTSVKGKITSSHKRLTAPQREVVLCEDRANCQNSGALGSAAADDGTWGDSDDYVFFWSIDGQYYQWSGRYLYSDQPIRTRTEPLVVSNLPAA